MGFRDEIGMIDTPPVDDDRPSLPTMWWYNGVKAARTPGIFYLKNESLRTPPDAPWRPSARFDHEEGWEALRLHLLIICYRQQPYRIVTHGSPTSPRRERLYLPEWEPGAQFHTELLCLVEGIPEPVVWSCHGMTSRAVTGKHGIIATFRATILKEAEKIAQKRLPLWTFWMPLATQRDAHQRVVYADTGHGSMVTPPALDLPQQPFPDLCDTLFAGKDRITYGYALYEQYADWRTERRSSPRTPPDRSRAGPPDPDRTPAL